MNRRRYHRRIRRRRDVSAKRSATSPANSLAASQAHSSCRPVLGRRRDGLGMPALAHNLALGATSLTITPAAGFMIEACFAFFLVRSYSARQLRAAPAISRRLRIGMTLTLRHHHGWGTDRCRVQSGASTCPMVATGNQRRLVVLTAPSLRIIAAFCTRPSPARPGADSSARAGQRRRDTRRMSPIRSPHAT